MFAHEAKSEVSRRGRDDWHCEESPVSRERGKISTAAMAAAAGAAGAPPPLTGEGGVHGC